MTLQESLSTADICRAPAHRSEKLNFHEDTEELHDRYQILVDEVDASVRSE